MANINPSLKNTINVTESGGITLSVKATDDNKILINGKPLDTKEDVELVLSLVVKSLNTIVGG